VQQKLVDYVNNGGKLVMVGRMCSEDFKHCACTILKDAIGITQIDGGAPFVLGSIQAFKYRDVPVSFLETYSGAFDEVFARGENGEVTGFLKKIGNGKVMVLGAALAANTLDDLDIVNQMALGMDCPSLFKPGKWSDIRISCGEDGSFLFINNYQDDPIETTIEYKEEAMFGDHPVILPARRGLILPIDWRLRKDVLIHYVTSEIVEITEDGSTIVLRTEQDEFSAELTLSGYRCEYSETISESEMGERIQLQGKNGLIVLRKGGKVG
jgi:beta-galactosidase